MKPDGTAFLEWLHKRREAKERERLALGISEAEWLQRIHARADEILARLPRREAAPVVRDQGPNQSGREM